MNADTSEGWKELGGHEGLVTKALGEGRDGLAMNALEGEEDRSLGHFWPCTRSW